MMRLPLLLVSVPLAIAWTSACSGEASGVAEGARTQRYLLTGSSTVAPLMTALAEKIEADDPSLQIDVETGGSGRGIKDVRAGTVQAGMSSRDLKPEESAGLTVKPLVWDGIAFIVHRDNPLAAITADQVRAIYTGAKASWSDFGGTPRDIHVVHKAEGRATLEMFLQHFKVENSKIKPDAVIGDNAQGLRMVAGNGDAIAYVSIGDALRAVDRGEPVKLLDLDGKKPTLATVTDGSYPLRRTLYLLFPGAIDATGQRLLDMLTTPAGIEITQKLGFVPLVGRG